MSQERFCRFSIFTNYKSKQIEIVAFHIKTNIWNFIYLLFQPSHPEIKTGFENAGLAVSVTYILLGIPILVFHRMIEYWDFSSTCSTTLECPHFLFSLLPTLGRRGSVDHSAPNNRRGCHVRSALRSAQYLPSYAQCTTNTFVAPTHTHVHIPATKGT